MELRERIITAIVSAEPRSGGVQMVPARSQAEAAADAILAIPEIRGALADSALLAGERKIFDNYRADMGRLIKGVK